MARVIFFVAIFFVATAYADETIPLKDIWAFDMPGTKQLTDGQKDGKYVSPDGKLVSEIRWALQPMEPNQFAGEAFVVNAPVPKALPIAHRVLVQKEKPKSKFKAGDDLTLVFYALISAQYVHLKNVTIDGHTIKLQYNTIRHETLDVTEHFALIPLGKLASGKYTVEVSPAPKERSWISKGCSFEVD
jgi:hypothetical protein